MLQSNVDIYSMLIPQKFLPSLEDCQSLSERKTQLTLWLLLEAELRETETDQILRNSETKKFTIISSHLKIVETATCTINSFK